METEETEEPQYWCCMHGGWHTDKKYAQHLGRCRLCHNAYQSWRPWQKKQGKPCSVNDYRAAHGLVKYPRPDKPEASTECSVCMKRPRERGSFCRGCHNAYTNWSQRRRRSAKANNREADCSLDEFRLAVDTGWVVPRHEGEFHIGQVVKGL